MLTRLLILLFFLIIAFGYLGAKISVKTENFKHSYIFWALYIVTIITSIQIIFCIYMYLKYRTKEGDLGPRGFDGYPGTQGDDGECDQNRCRKDLLLLLIVKKMEDKINRKLTEQEINQIKTNMNFDNLDLNSKLKKMTYDNLEKFNDKITYQIEIYENPLEEIEEDGDINIKSILDNIINL